MQAKCSFMAELSKHPNINFMLAKENDGHFSFLDIYISCGKGKFVTAYQKKTFSGVFTNFNNFYLKPIKPV